VRQLHCSAGAREEMSHSPRPRSVPLNNDNDDGAGPEARPRAGNQRVGAAPTKNVGVKELVADAMPWLAQ
jgi:hypothetical protein